MLPGGVTTPFPPSCGTWSQALSMAGGLAAQYSGRVTVLMLDEKAMEPEDAIRRMDVLAT